MCEYTRVSRAWKYAAVELENIDYNGIVMLRHISRERFKITVLSARLTFVCLSKKVLAIDLFQSRNFGIL